MLAGGIDLPEKSCLLISETPHQTELLVQSWSRLLTRPLRAGCRLETARGERAKNHIAGPIPRHRCQRACEESRCQSFRSVRRKMNQKTARIRPGSKLALQRTRKNREIRRSRASADPQAV